MSDDVEYRLRAVLEAQAAALIPGAAPVQSIDALARQLNRRRMLAASSAAVTAVVAVLAVTAFTIGQPANDNPGVAGGPTGGSSSVAAPASQPVSPTRVTTGAGAATPAIRNQADAVRHYLETTDLRQQAQISTSFHGRIYCGLDVLGRSADGSQLFTWVLCEEYYDNAGTATLGAGTAQALLVKVTGAGAATAVHSVQAPPGGAHYAANVRRLFDQRAADTVLSGKAIPVDQPESTLARRARADLAAGQLPGPATTTSTGTPAA